MVDLAARIWVWLPAKATRRRVTTVGVIAAGLRVGPDAVAAMLADMEIAGHATRDRKIGPRANSWHRGLPLPAHEDHHGQGELF